MCQHHLASLRPFIHQSGCTLVMNYSPTKYLKAGQFSLQLQISFIWYVGLIFYETNSPLPSIQQNNYSAYLIINLRERNILYILERKSIFHFSLSIYLMTYQYSKFHRYTDTLGSCSFDLYCDTLRPKHNIWVSVVYSGMVAAAP